MTRKCILDVDGILWDFHSVLNPILAEEYGSPVNIKSTKWDWYLDYMTEEQFFHGVDMAHERQLENAPFPGADDLFDALYETGHQVIVASHRQRNMAADLATWLMINISDKWSGVYTGPDKKFLIEPDDLVIDDSPETINHVLSIGAESWTLKWPWNRDTLATKFGNLAQMAAKLRRT